MNLSMIAATDMNGAIGNENMLLIHSESDMARFKKITKNKCIIMGRKTFESLGTPLKGRSHIVITRDEELLKNSSFYGFDVHYPPVVYADSLDNAIELLGRFTTEYDCWTFDKSEAVIIGGAEIYNNCIKNHLVDTFHLTVFDYSVKEHDAVIDISMFNPDDFHPFPEMCRIVETGQPEVLDVYFAEFRLGYNPS